MVMRGGLCSAVKEVGKGTEPVKEVFVERGVVTKANTGLGMSKRDS